MNSTIGGGSGNSVSPSASSAVIPGGSDNHAGASYSFAAGHQAQANHAGSFVWADNTGTNFSSSANNQFLIRASSGVGIGTDAPQAALDVAGDINYSGALAKLDTAEQWAATVRSADFQLGHSTRRGTPGRALVDHGDTLKVNFGYDWAHTTIGGSVNMGHVEASWLGANWIEVAEKLTTTALEVEASALVMGQLQVWGLKLATVETSQGRRGLHAEESVQCWFTDYGFGRLEKGRSVVQIDPLFAETVNLNEPYHVFVQVNDSDCEGAAILNKTPTTFEVRELRKGKSDAEFSYRLVALRRGYEKFRLDLMPEQQKFPGKSTKK
jgi:hypothetical protein